MRVAGIGPGPVSIRIASTYRPARGRRPASPSGLWITVAAWPSDDRAARRRDPVGKEPDVRFSYANERTFLAWNRTSLALIATGLAVVSLLPKFNFPVGRRLIGVPLIALGAALAIMSYRRWAANERRDAARRALAAVEPQPGARARDRDRRDDRRGRRRVRRQVSGDPAREPVADDPDVHGLAGERTDLAWSRSGLAFVVCVAAIAKRIAPELATLDARAIVVLALVVGGLAWGFAIFWARAVAGTTLTGRRIADEHKLRLIAYGTAAIGGAAAVVALLPER